MNRPLRFVLFLLVLTAFAGATLLGAYVHAVREFSQAAPPGRGFAAFGTLENKGRAVLAVYCGSCHQSGRSGLDFDNTTTNPVAMRRDRETWEMALQKLRSGQMPPRQSPQPNKDERAALIAWIEKCVRAEEPQSIPPRRLMVRRLNRLEYLNAVRDLFGVPLGHVDDLPRDELTWEPCDEVPAPAPELLAQYRTATRDIIAEALTTEIPPDLQPISAVDGEDADAATPCDFRGTAQIFLEGPLEKTGAEAARDILASFTREAYRGPVDADELDRLLAVFESEDASGATFRGSIAAALAEVLISPRFLYRIESASHSSNAAQLVPETELADRLSFFFWNSGPDEELLRQAQNGTLRQNLQSQVQRMLRDRRFRAFTESFADYWLGLGKLADVPRLDVALRRDMRQETLHFTDSVLRANRSVLEFLDADYTFLNERLARHYGVAGVQGESLRRVSLRRAERGGILTHGSIMTFTACSEQTSPVQRGKWVLDNLLGTPPPRPPANVLEGLEQTNRRFPPGTARQQLELHRQHAGCAGCHAKMDAIGLALENFDAAGVWRTEVNGRAVDTSNLFFDDESIDGPKALIAFLRRQRQPFVRALTEKMLSYSLGRKLSAADHAVVERISASVAQNDYQAWHMILEIVRSDPFQAGR